jgi:hypothetical protein
MRIFQSYRRIVSAFLVVIYLLVIAPVQVWHSHSTEQSSHIEFGGKETLAFAEQASNSNDCEVCSHHYSIHFEELPQLPENFTANFARQYADVVQYLHCNQLYLSANKGPPAA